jgi:hypothetical protein
MWHKYASFRTQASPNRAAGMAEEWEAVLQYSTQFICFKSRSSEL